MDIQLSPTEHDKLFEVKGYVKYCDDPACKTLSPLHSPNPSASDSAKTITLVSKAYVEGRTAPAGGKDEEDKNGD